MNLPTFVEEVFCDADVNSFEYSMNITHRNAPAFLMEVSSNNHRCAKFTVTPFYNTRSYGFYFESAIRIECVDDDKIPLKQIVLACFKGNCRVISQWPKIRAEIILDNGEIIAGSSKIISEKEVGIVTFVPYPRRKGN